MLWLLLVLLLLCSGVVSGSETALFSLPRQVLHEYGQAPGRLKRRVHTLMHRPRQVLMTVLIANTAINVAIFTVSFFMLRHLSSSMTLIAPLGGLLVPLAVIVVGEVLPKAVVLANPRRFAPAISRSKRATCRSVNSRSFGDEKWVPIPPNSRYGDSAIRTT